MCPYTTTEPQVPVYVSPYYLASEAEDKGAAGACICVPIGSRRCLYMCPYTTKEPQVPVYVSPCYFMRPRSIKSERRKPEYEGAAGVAGGMHTHTHRE
jgi:hypothetical protein